ncbi:hypothetical protein C0J52_06513 [Blattella germanica]|nr:hypothetical protein C0J52_06513 [Blattella germanica]
MTATNVIGPFILRDTMNAERYLQMLEDYVSPMVSAWDNINDVIFMQDGAPPHFANVVRAWLDEMFPGRVPHEWPARSLDLTPCDFFLWGWAKDEVYRTKPHILEQLEARIQYVITRLPPEDSGFHTWPFVTIGRCHEHFH